MAAPAYTVAGLGLDVSAADAMELQSDDGGIDFTDGDIELDFEPEISQPQDDDVSLDDAASTTGEMQDEHAENDDYMVDQEDVIEEDEINAGDDGGADIELPAVDEATTVTATQQTTTNDDDDDDELLDYTEDEEYHNPANRSPWFKTHQWVQIRDSQADESVEQQNETTVWRQQEDRIQTQDDQTQVSPEQHPTEQQEDIHVQDGQAQVSTEQHPSEQQDETPAVQDHNWTQTHNDHVQDETAFEEQQQDETSAEWQQGSIEQQEETSAEWQQEWTQAYDEQTEDVAGQQEGVSSEWQQTDWTQDQDEQAEDPEQQQDEIPADLQAMMSQSNEKSDEQEEEQHEHEREHRSPSVNQNEDNRSDGGHGGVSAQGQEESADGETAHEDPAQSYQHDESAEHNESQDQEPFEMPSVTISYEDNELWLFKQHDFDNSGDWLIEDVSLAKASMSDLMRACRFSLGDVVSNEMEIGFRFDHFLNMELFEDNTACVAVSLERLVNYYHMLHANDGNNEPESFYITLLFRPRFATLLSDIAKFADQGLGYSAFDAAVTAGETHFSAGVVGSSSAELTEWDKEEEKGDGEEQEQELVQSEVQSDVHHGERDQDEGDGTQDTYEDDGVEVHETEEVPTNVASHDEHGSHHEEEHEPEITISTEMPTNVSETVAQPERERSRSAVPTEAELEARRLKDEEDLIDYSDEEDEEPAPAKVVEQAPATQLSPSSTTVQGDESANVHGQEAAADSPRLNEQTSQDQDKIDYDTVEEPSYEDFVKAFEADESYPEFDVDEPGGDEADANQADAEYDEYQNPDQEAEQALMNGDGSVVDFDYSGNTAVENHDLANTDDFLDLDSGAEWAAYEDVDEEDGVASTAEHQTASSINVNEVSPQGQKRSIDEAGHGADAATNATDVKRPRV